MIIKTSNTDLILPFISKLHLPKQNSHKGENGKVLVIGGSSLFHAASLWAAEVASYFTDIVHYSSTVENAKIFLSLKKKFINGIVVPQNDIYSYVGEDDAILVGPGMLREAKTKNKKLKIKNFEEILSIKNEGEYTYYLTQYLIENFPAKRFVFDAGSLQMIENNSLLKLRQKPIITPHQIEFEKLFNYPIRQKSLKEKTQIVKELAKKYQTVILLKAIDDIISDGEKVYVIQGGNAGLTKGGSGDVLAGLVVSFYAKNEPLESAVVPSYLLKKTADVLFKEKGYWYNINDVIQMLPKVLTKLINL